MYSVIPHLKATPTSKQLIVHGQPFLIRGAELQNSSFSSAKFMRELWEPLKDVNVNTVLGSITWEMIEPEEGEFDFTEVDRIILDARRHGLKLVFLWFGSWKNGCSNYVPSWVKLSPERFPRVWIRDDSNSLKATEVVTPLHIPTAEADAKAFAALMKHIKLVDKGHSTVIMVQPENECGVLGDSRDRSELATEAYQKPVPKDLLEFLRRDWPNLNAEIKRKLQATYDAGLLSKVGRSWEDVFGSSVHTDELFMAYHYARYVNIVAAAGKEEFPLPLYCNFWLNYNGDDSDNQFPALAGGGGLPGDYPSGGGVATVLDIWMHYAKAVDFIAPDLYLNDYSKVCSAYRHRNQPLFIPEQRRDEYGARRSWLAIGSYQALGVSPFGVDSLPLSTEECAYTKHFGLLASISNIVLEAQRRPGAMVGFFFDELSEDGDESPPTTVQMGSYEIEIKRAFVTGKPGTGYGLLIQLEDDDCPKHSRFLLVGQGFRASFKSLDPKAYYTGILKVEEKEVDANGDLRTLRRLNGDETRSGQFVNMPNDDPDYSGFPISITIPARTKIAEASIYCLMQSERPVLGP